MASLADLNEEHASDESEQEQKLNASENKLKEYEHRVQKLQHKEDTIQKLESKLDMTAEALKRSESHVQSLKIWISEKSD